VPPSRGNPLYGLSTDVLGVGMFPASVASRAGAVPARICTRAASTICSGHPSAAAAAAIFSITRLALYSLVSAMSLRQLNMHIAWYHAAGLEYVF
jgi:hypothetical protein